MARQAYRVNNTEKQFEIFNSYGGGMVTQAHQEKLRDDEAVLIENGDIIAGGVIEARGAYAQTNSPSSTINGWTQGRFKYTTIGGERDIVAIDGRFYMVVNNTYTQLAINGLPQFQNTRPIEAVQLRDKMYFATGSGVVVYDGITMSLLEVYAPNGLEALYIGTNGMAVNPDNYLSDATGAANAILGVVPSIRYGVINQLVTFTAYIQKVPSDTLEYQFEVKRSDEFDYVVKQEWTTSKAFTTSFEEKADYVIRVSMRKTGSTKDNQLPTLSQYILPRYKVNTTVDEKPEPTVTFANLSLCNRIFIHYDRLFIYGDTTNPDFLYISHLNKFGYFPRTNIIKVTDPLRGALQSVKQYKSFLVCFTDGSIQTIYGKTPKDYVKENVHTTIGTKSPYSVHVMKNYIVFIGADNGTYILKSFSYASDDKMNVERIDDKVKDKLEGLLKTSTRVLATIYNNQYYLYIENATGNYIYRYYYELNVWVRDTIPFSISSLSVINNVLNMSSAIGGIIYKLKYDVFRDSIDTQYSLVVKSKDYDFGMPFHRKKLKQYQLLINMTIVSTVQVGMYLDNEPLEPNYLNTDVLQNTDAQKLKLMVSGRFRYVKTDLIIPVNERVQIVGFGFVFKQNTPK